MGIFNTLRYSSKAAELIEVIEILWIKLKSYHNEHFSCIHVNDFEAKRLGLYNGFPTNGDTQKMLEYMNRLTGLISLTQGENLNTYLFVKNVTLIRS